jgi:hypothetical protein
VRSFGKQAGAGWWLFSWRFMFGLLALRAFLRLEAYRLRTGVSGDEAQAAILREAIRRYWAHPRYVL